MASFSKAGNVLKGIEVVYSTVDLTDTYLLDKFKSRIQIHKQHNFNMIFTRISCGDKNIFNINLRAFTFPFRKSLNHTKYYENRGKIFSIFKINKNRPPSECQKLINFL